MKLFQSKLNGPIIDGYIERQALKLDKIDSCKLTLVCAPAGFGKSSIISKWLNEKTPDVLWYSLDPSDIDTYQFLSYLIHGLNKHKIMAQYDLMTLLESVQTIGPDAIMDSIIQILFDIERSFYIVLDDYHLIDSDQINQWVQKLISHTGNKIKIILISREDTSLSLSKLRVSGNLFEIRMKDLRFNHQEVEDLFLKQGLNLSEEDVIKLNTRTEGWISGLLLAGMTLKDRPDASAFIEAFSGNNYYIMDYLLEEVLSKIPSDLYDFLLKSSLLEGLTEDLCDYVLEYPRGQSRKLLSTLSTSNNFIIQLDTDQTWFRYHHLFKDLLNQKVSETDIDRQKIHIRAAKWYRDYGTYDLAIDHAIRGNDYELAASLVEKVWRQMDQNLQSKRWLGLIDKLPEDLILNRPVLSMGLGWALLDIGDFDRSLKWLKHAEKLSTKPKEELIIEDHKEYGLIEASIYSAYSYHAGMIGDIEKQIDYAEKAMAIYPNEEYLRIGVMQILIGFAKWRQGKLNEAYAVIKGGLNNVIKGDSPLSESTFNITLAELLIQKGELTQAKKIVEKSILKLKDQGKLPISLSSFYLMDGQIELIRGKVNEAKTLLNQAKENGEKYGLPDFKYKFKKLEGMINLLDEAFDQSLEKLEEALAIYYPSPIPEYESLHRLMYLDQIRLGNLYETDYLLEQTPVESSLDRYMAMVFDNHENMEANLRLLDEEEKILLEEDHLRSLIDLKVVKSILSRTIDRKLAEKDLRQAIALSKRERILMPFLLFKDELKDLVSNVDLPEELRQVFNVKTKTQLLTSRELDVLKLMAKGYSNKEICETLYLALSTVKGYNRNIFDKLDVKRRTEAVSKGSNLGLIE